MRNHNADTIITTQWRRATEKDIPLTLFERVVCERELETEQNCNIVTPTLLAITAFLSRSPGLLNRGPEGPASLGAGFLYRILSPTCLIPKLINRGSWGPFCWVLAFSTASYLQLVWSLNSLNFLCTELYNSSTPTQSLPITGHRNMHFRRLWNGMFDRHRAEITVMQFTGHSLPVHQFVTVP